MSYSTFAESHAATVVVRNVVRRDRFHYFTIALCLALLAFGLIFGAPDLGSAALLVSGP